MRLRSSSRTSSAAAFCSRRRRSRPAFPIRGCSWRRGLSVARWRSPGRWPTRSWRRCGPRAGGEYVYLRAAFGRVAAFLTGWTSFIAGFSGAIAASAVVLAAYVGRFIPAANDATPLFVVPLPFVPLTFSRRAAMALCAIGLMTWIHVRGVGPGRFITNAARGSEGLRAAHLHRSGVHDRCRIRREPACRLRVRSLAAPGSSR